MSDARNDGELLTAHLGGDAGAFEALARRHAAMVLGVARRLLGPGPDAEDAAQATFMLLVRKARKLSGARELGAWLHRSARLVAPTALRARGRRARHEREAAAMRPAGEEAREPEALWAQCGDRMDGVLDSLPEGCRQALVLCYFEGLSQGEAAKRLAVPESTLSSRCTRGLEKLRAKLGVERRRLGAAALGALLVERAAEAVPANFIPSVVSAANGAAASAPVLALTEGALKVMFWSKMKVAAASVAAVAFVAVAAPFAVGAASGEGAGKDPSVAKKVVRKAAAGEPVPVNGLKLKLSLAPANLVCSEKCRKMLHLANGIKRCGCGQMCNAGHKHCWNCAFATGTCEVCGKKLPAGATELRSFKAGEQVRLALTFENVSKKKMKVCDYLLGMRLVKWQITGPDAASVKRVPTGMDFMLAAITGKNFPELESGGKRTFGIYVRGNPPGIGYGAVSTRLLKAGAYKVVAVYTNKQDSYYDGRLRQQVRVAGEVWKNTVRSQTLLIKVTGTVKPLPKGPRPIMAL